MDGGVPESPLTQVFTTMDLLTAFLQSLLASVRDCTGYISNVANVAEDTISTLESLYRTSKRTYRLLRSSKVLSVITYSLKMVKVSSISALTVEYNHKFLRYRSKDMGVMHHLLWCIEDRDAVTFEYILQGAAIDLDEYHSFIEKYYKLYFEAGRRNYREFYRLMHKHLPSHSKLDEYSRISKVAMYTAGKAYAGLYIKASKLDNMSEADIKFILFEAIRGAKETGGNKKLTNQLVDRIVNKDEVVYIFIVASVAADNLEALVRLAPNLSKRRVEKLKVPIIDQQDGWYYFYCVLPDGEAYYDLDTVDRLIVYGLHYGSYKVLAYLDTIRSELSIVVDISSGITPLTLESYNWLKTRAKVHSKDKPYIVESATEQGRFDLARQLEGRKHKKLNQSMIENYIESNSYHAIEWHRLCKSDGVLRKLDMARYENDKYTINTTIRCMWRNSGYIPKVYSRAI